MAKEVGDLLPFLSPDARSDLKYFAVDYILGLTGTENGKKFLKENEIFVKKLLDLTHDPDTTSSCRDSYLAIVNLSAEPVIADKILEYNVIPIFLNYVLEQKSQHADKVAMILSNLTRTERGAQQTLNYVTSSSEMGLCKIVEVFCKKDFNPNANLHYLAPFLSNLTQLPKAREFILDRKRCVIQRLLTFTQFPESVVRRGGVVAVLKNCCFETESHEWLLGESVDILPHLLLPLAGPEEFDEDEMEKLPPDLQYLGEEKGREPDPLIRRMLLEALLQGFIKGWAAGKLTSCEDGFAQLLSSSQLTKQSTLCPDAESKCPAAPNLYETPECMLCSTSKGRAYLREKNTYVILRELDKWEKDESSIKACHNVVHVLIADEPESGMENLKDVEVPKNIVFDQDRSVNKN